jgi:hypothetical protein
VHVVILTPENDEIKTQVSGTPNINEAGQKEGELWNLDAQNKMLFNYLQVVL